jgi:hypothetical protein
MPAAGWQNMEAAVVEKRQERLYKLTELKAKNLKVLLAAAKRIDKLDAQIKRLLKPPGGKVKYHEITGIGGGAPEGLNDSLEGL